MSDKEQRPENEVIEVDSSTGSENAPEPIDNDDSQLDIPAPEDATGIAPQSETDVPRQSPERTPKSGRSTVVAVFAFLALLLAIAALGGGGYLHREYLELKSDTDALASSQQNLVQTLDFRPRLDELDQRLDAISQRSENAAGAADARLEKLQDSVRVLQEIGSRGDRDWVIAETRYLLKMAQHRLALAGDLDSATAAIRAADAQLHTLADVGLLPVREALAGEIATLRSTPRPDIEGLVLNLIQLARRCNNLPLTTDRRVSIGIAQGIDSSTGDANGTPIDTDFSSEMVKLVRQFVVVKRVASADSKNPGEDSTADQDFDRRAKLQLALQKAQIAALRRDQIDFVAAVGTAKKLLTEHFDNDNDQVRRFAEDLLSVEQSQVRPDVKGVGAALQLLDKIVAESVDES